jgi:hypothetical protein
MTQSSAASGAAPATLTATVCPLCHTAGPLMDASDSSDFDWQCPRCHQMWTADRLAVVEGYAAFSQK